MKNTPKLFLGLTKKQGTGVGRKILSMLLCLVMVLSLLPAFSPQASAANISWNMSQGTLRATNGNTYTITGGSITGNNTTNIDVAANATVTLIFSGNTTIDKTGATGANARPAITIATGATVTIVVNSGVTVTLKGSHAGAPLAGVFAGPAGAGGQGAFAGIYVSETATLKLRSSGTLNTYGGNASNGADGIVFSFEGIGNGGGGGAGAGIGGNGGGGGGGGGSYHAANTAGGIGGSGGYGAVAGTNGVNATKGVNTGKYFGGNGGAGGTSGTVYTYTGGINAYGGNGGNGGLSAWSGVTNNDGGAGGGGGYPAAGIGGGGGGGGGGAADDLPGAGGYSGGGKSGQTGPSAPGGVNGANGATSNTVVENNKNFAGGEGYLSNELGGGSGSGGYNLAVGYSCGGAGGGATTTYLADGVVARDGQNSGNTTWAANVQVIKGRAAGQTGVGSGAGYYGSGVETLANGASNGAVLTGIVYHDISTASLTVSGATNYYVTGTTTANNITVNAGYTGKMIIDNVTIDMRNNVGKSAIDVKSGASLALEVIGTSKLYGAKGKEVEGWMPVNVASPLIGGKAGSAGVNVPSNATISISGTGTLYAYGGDASPGTFSTTIPGDVGRAGGAGGGGAGAGIGGSGGNGGNGGWSNTPPTNSGSGQTAGNITVAATVFAYGGAGASGSLTGSSITNWAGGGGGGYPAAGIGGGGGGGGGGGATSVTGNAGGGGGGGGGFTGGATGGAPASINGADGNRATLDSYPDNVRGQAGSGYFSNGGKGGLRATVSGSKTTNTDGANGGAGGSGGTITILGNNVNAFNGSWKTTAASGAAGNEWGSYAMGNPAGLEGSKTKVIRGQVNQGMGGGAGFVETQGSVIDARTPDAPTAQAASLVAGGDGKFTTIDVSFVKPVKEGKDPVTSYKIIGSNGINKEFKLSELKLTGAVYTASIPGLLDNTAYVFSVAAGNSVGYGAPSGETVSVTTKGVPLMPREVSGEIPAGSYNNVNVYWKAPDLTYNNLPIKGYKLVLNPIGKADTSTPDDLTDILYEEGGEGEGGSMGKPVPVDPEAVRIELPLGVGLETTADGRYIKNVTGLHYGTVYSVTVAAINKAGEGQFGGGALFATPSVATAPTVTVKRPDASKNELKVEWTHPENAVAGGIPELSSFVIERTAKNETNNNVVEEKAVWEFTKKSDDTWATANDAQILTVTGAGLGTKYSFTDSTMAAPTNGRTYTYAVHGKNQPGAGIAGSGKFTFEPAAPAAPVVNTDPESMVNQLVLSWTAPQNNGELPILSYKIYDGDKEVGSVPHESGKNDYTYTYKELDIASEHALTVSAVNESGEGAKSPEAAATTLDVPGMVVDAEAKATHSTKGEVSWKTPAEDGGSPITGYLVTYYNTTSPDAVTKKILALNDPLLVSEGGKYSYELTGLTKGQNYMIKVFALNAVDPTGEHGKWTGEACKITTWKEPSAPQNLTVESITDQGTLNGGLKLGWTAPTNINGSAILSYTVYVTGLDVNSGAIVEERKMIANIAVGAITEDKGVYLYSISPEHLTPGTKYKVEVTATNTIGEGGAVSNSSGIAMTTPDTPIDIAASAQTDKIANVTWGEAANNGSAILKYEVHVFNAGGKDLFEGITPTVSGTETAPILTYTLADKSVISVTYPNGRLGHKAVISGLAPYTNYDIGVCAVNVPGMGAFGKASIKTMRVPFAASSITAEPTNVSGGAEVSWTAPATAVGTPMVSYKVELFLGAIAEGSTPVDTKTVLESAAHKVSYTNLTNGSTYTVRITPINKIGDGDATTAVFVPRRPADAPSDAIYTMKSGTELKIEWTNPSGVALGGDAVTGYGVKIFDTANKLLREFKTDATGAIIGETPENGIQAVFSATGTGGSAELSGMTMGAGYKIKVRVLTGAGDGTEISLKNNDIPSTELIKMWDLPGQPATKATPTNKDGKIEIVWDYPLYDGDSDNDPETKINNHTSVTDYKVMYIKSSELTGENPVWTTVEWSENMVDGGKRGDKFYLTVAGVTGTEYQFKVLSQNGAGWTDETKASTVRATPRSLALAPVVGDVLTGNSRAQIVSINKPLDNGDILGDGGDTITAYKVYAALATKVGEVWKESGEYVYKDTITAPANGELKNVYVPALENGMDYMIQVRAVNGAWTGDNTSGDRGAASEAKHVRVGMPLTPENFSVNLGIGNSATSTYSAAEGNGSAIEYYKIYVGQGENPVLEPYNKKLENGVLVPLPDGEFVKYTGLSGTVYGDLMGDDLTIAVSAVNRVGESPMTAPIKVKVGAPSTPVLNPIEMLEDGVKISWAAVNNNGAKLEGYYIYITDTTTPGAEEKKFTVGSTALTYSHLTNNETLPLVLGKSYCVQVAAKSLAGESPRSEMISFKFGVPQKPTMNSVELGTGELTVKFTPYPEADADKKVTGFVIYANGMARAALTLNPEMVNKEYGDTGLKMSLAVLNDDGSYTVAVPGLANGSTYRMQVAAFNKYGEGNKSDSMGGTPATTAGAPTNLVGTPTSDTEISLSWRGPAYDGGSTIKSYKVTVYDAETNGALVTNDIDSSSSISVIQNGDTPSATITGLQKGKSYYFGVQAITSVANPGAEGVSKAITTFANPGAPKITVLESGVAGQSYYLDIKWDTPETDGGTPITGYNVYCGSTKPENKGVLITGNTYRISTGISYGRNYQIEVEAVNAVGKTKSVVHSIKVGQLGAPKITDAYSTVNGDSGTITLKWEVSTGVNEGYKVFDLEDMVRTNINVRNYLGIDLDNFDYSKLNLDSKEMSDLLTKCGIQPYQGIPVGGDGYTTSYDYERAEIGKTYYLSLAAYSNNAGLGIPTRIYPIVVGAPTSPKLGTLTAGKEQLTATFEKPTNTNGLDIVGYKVYVDGAAQADMILAGEGSATSITAQIAIPEASCGRAVSVSISAVSETGDKSETYESLPSNTMSATPWTLPSTPEMGTDTPGNATFDLVFEKSNGNGLAIDSYNLYWNGSKVVSEKVSFKDNGDGTITATVTGVRNGFAPGTERGYEVYVTAVTKSGGETFESLAPNEKKYIATGIPGTPEINKLVATKANGVDTISVGFTEPEGLSGDAQKGYNIEILVENEVVYKKSTANNQLDIVEVGTAGNPTPAAGSGEKLKPGTTYYVRVQAKNSVGPGAFSAEAPITVGAPNAPENVNPVPGNARVTLTWTAPFKNASEITLYTIYVEGADGTKITKTIDRSENIGVVENLINGTKYTFCVTATNGQGESVKSTSCASTPGAVPASPMNAKAVATSDTSITLTWDAPANDGGLPILRYVVNDSEHKPIGIITSDAERQFTINGLTKGTGYVYEIIAVNNVGVSPAAVTASVKTHQPPNKPAWEGAASFDSTIRAKWFAPTDTGGSPIASYTMLIQKYANDGITLETVHTIENIIPGEGDIDPTRGYITYVVPKELYKLVLGTEYKVSVAAKNATVNEIGEGSDKLSVLVTAPTSASVPGAPTVISAKSSHQAVSINWKRPDYDGSDGNGNGGITNYFIYYGEVGADGKVAKYEKISTGPSITSFTVPGLKNDTEYSFYLVANNLMGESAPSAEVKQTPKFIAAPSAPTGMFYYSNVASTQIVTKWDAAPGANGYRVFINGVEKTGPNGTTDLFFAFDSASGVQYYIQVEAFNEGGASSRSSVTARSGLNTDIDNDGKLDPNIDTNLDLDFDGVADPVDTVKAPDAPTGLKATPNGLSSITLTWTAPANTGGADVPLSNYKIYIGNEVVEQSASLPCSYTYTGVDGKGVTAGEFYTFQISATNGISGEGTRSDMLQFYIQPSDAPKNLVVTKGSAFNEYVLTWEAPTTATPPAGYYLQCNGVDDTTLITGTSTTITPALEKDFVYRVMAVNGTEGSYTTTKTTDPVYISTMVPTPAAPTVLKAEVVEPEEGVEADLSKNPIEVTWSESADAVYYELYLDGVLQEVSGSTEIPAGTLTATVETGEAAGTHTVYVMAVNRVDSVIKTSPKSNIVTITTEEPIPDAPEQVKNLEATVTGTTIDLTWDAVTHANPDYSIEYVVYMAEDKGAASVYEVVSGANLAENSFSYAAAADTDYLFKVAAVAVKTADPSTTVPGLESNVLPVTTKVTVVIPNVPTGLTASLDETSREVTLTWTASGGAESYNVYGEDQQKINNDPITGTSFTFVLTEVEGKTSYSFQVTAVNTAGESAKSIGATVTTTPPEAEVPNAPDAPVLTRYVFTNGAVPTGGGAPDDTITVYWKAPENAANVTNAAIKEYVFALQGKEFRITAAQSAANYKADTGEYFHVFHCKDESIVSGMVLPLTVKSYAEVENTVTPGSPFKLYSGVQAKTFSIGYAVNVDENGDGVADKDLDIDYDGIIDNAVVTVYLKGTLEAGGSDKVKAEFEVSDSRGVALAKDKYTVEMGADGAFTVNLQIPKNADPASEPVQPFSRSRANLMADTRAGETYSLKISKANCTSYTISDIPIDVSTTNLELGKAVLYVGDANGDDFVDSKDVAVVKGAFNKTVTVGDVNSDGVVDSKDMALVKGSFGKQFIVKAWTK